MEMWRFDVDGTRRCFHCCCCCCCCCWRMRDGGERRWLLSLVAASLIAIGSLIIATSVRNKRRAPGVTWPVPTQPDQNHIPISFRFIPISSSFYSHGVSWIFEDLWGSLRIFEDLWGRQKLLNCFSVAQEGQITKKIGTVVSIKKSIKMTQNHPKPPKTTQNHKKKPAKTIEIDQKWLGINRIKFIKIIQNSQNLLKLTKNGQLASIFQKLASEIAKNRP